MKYIYIAVIHVYFLNILKKYFYNAWFSVYSFVLYFMHLKILFSKEVYRLYSIAKEMNGMPKG